MRKFVRDAAIIVAIPVLLFVGVEATVRLLAPQKLETVLVGKDPLGLRDDLLGHVNRPNAHIRVKGPEYESDYQVNEQGFRDAAIYAPYPAEGVTRILLVGDSFTFGVGNAYDESWPVILERNLRKAGREVEIIKAGVPAYDTRSEVLHIERLVDQFHPDVVALTFLPNDLFTNMPLAADGATSGTANPLQTDRTEFNDPAVRAASDKKSSLHSIVLMTRLMMMNDPLYLRLYMITPRAAYFSVPPTDVMNRQMDITRALLERAWQFCRARDIDFVVVSIPQQFQVIALAQKPEPTTFDARYIDREFTKFAQDRKMQWFSLLTPLVEQYAETRIDQYYRYDGHLTPEGNSIVATSLTSDFSKWLGETRSDEQHERAVALDIPPEN